MIDADTIKLRLRIDSSDPAIDQMLIDMRNEAIARIENRTERKFAPADRDPVGNELPRSADLKGDILMLIRWQYDHPDDVIPEGPWQGLYNNIDRYKAF